MDVNGLTEKIISCAIAVHREPGPGLLASVYEAALEIELNDAGRHTTRQKEIPVRYKGIETGEHRLDMLVENIVVIELKSVERFDPLFQAQLLGYLKPGGYPVGLLINFNSRVLKNGIKRMTIQ